MVPRLLALTAALCVALAGCTGGGGGGDGTTTTTTGGSGIGGNVSVGNNTVSGSVSMTNTTGPGNGTEAPLAAFVVIQGNQFVNDTVTVQVGGSVTWTHNDGSTMHTVTADDGSFDSSPNCSPTVDPLPPTGDCMQQGDTFTVTFSAPGTFTYHCKVHPSMTGTVQVVEAS